MYQLKFAYDTPCATLLTVTLLSRHDGAAELQLLPKIEQLKLQNKGRKLTSREVVQSVAINIPK